MSLLNFDHQISWSQFSHFSSRPSGQQEDAQIHPDMSFTHLQLDRNGRAATVRSIDVTIRLITKDCWVVTSAMTDSLLQHEQGHYDILAIAAREIYNRLVGLSASSTHALQTEINNIRSNMSSRLNTVDTRYDNQTDHGRNTATQQTWQQRIAAERLNPNGSIDNLPQ